MKVAKTIDIKVTQEELNALNNVINMLNKLTDECGKDLDRLQLRRLNSNSAVYDNLVFASILLEDVTEVVSIE